MDLQTFLFVIESEEPLTFHQAVDSERWIEVMKDDIEAFHENVTWEIIPRPINKNVEDYACKLSTIPM